MNNLNTIDTIFIKSIDTIYVSRIDTIHSSHLDTIIKYNVPPGLIQQYTEILKSTNEQLGLWTNPYAIMLAILGILFTLLAIVAAVLIWSQSRDFKKTLNDSINKIINKYEVIIKAFIDQKRKDLEKIDKEIKIQIDQYKNELVNANDERKLEIEKEIIELENKSKIVEKEAKSPFVRPFNIKKDPLTTSVESFLQVEYDHHICSNCGYGYLVEKTPLFSTDYATSPRTSFGLGEKVIKCPKCGNVEKK